MMTRFLVLLLAALAGSLGAQTAPPLPVHRVPPPNYPATAQQAAAILAAAGPSPAVPTPAPAPSGFKERRAAVALDPNAAQALALASEYLQRTNTPTLRPDGRLEYNYGAGPVTLVCAPARWCSIDLEPGERITVRPEAADARWDVVPTAQQRDGDLSTTVTVRARQVGLDASLLINTDRRTYDLRLVSKASDYMPRIVFRYPNAGENAWAAYQTALLASPPPSQQQPPPAPAPAPAKEVVWTEGYTMRGKRRLFHRPQHPSFWPAQVRDNGQWVYITLPDAIARSQAPVLMLRNHAGVLEPANYSLDGHVLIVRQLFVRAALVSGSGRHAQVVDIVSPRTGLNG